MTIKLRWSEPARRGHFEGRRGGLLTGWAYDRAMPRSPARLLLLAPGRSVAVLADRYRVDVQRAGHGDGYCGFAVAAVRFAGDEELRCVWADSGEPLPSPRAIRPTPRITASGDWSLLLDPPRPGDPRISGAVFHPGQPARRMLLGLACEGRLLDQARACLYRAERPGGGDGFCGFVFAAPARTARLELLDVERRQALTRLRR